MVTGLLACQEVRGRFWAVIVVALTVMAAGLCFSPAYAGEKQTASQKVQAAGNFQGYEKGSREMKQEIMKHEVPPLPYDYNELEPYYDEETLRLHHDKHHAAYVKGLNLAEEKLAEARRAGDYSLVRHWERSMAFNGSGHLLHSIFWTNMAPNRDGTLRNPSGALADQITRDFGSYDAFKKQFSSTATSVEGSGWSILGWMPEFGKLVVLEAEIHQNQTLWGIKPLLVVDVWEHAYYLRYQNRRAEWIENWWYLVNWDDVAKRFDQARK